VVLLVGHLKYYVDPTTLPYTMVIFRIWYLTTVLLLMMVTVMILFIKAITNYPR